MIVESNYVIAITTLSDWLKRLAPVFQPMRSKTKTKTNRTMYAWFFPRFERVTGNCEEVWLVHRAVTPWKCFVRIFWFTSRKTLETHSFATLTRSFLKFCGSWIKIRTAHFLWSNLFVTHGLGADISLPPCLSCLSVRPGIWKFSVLRLKATSGPNSRGASSRYSALAKRPDVPSPGPPFFFAQGMRSLICNTAARCNIGIFGALQRPLEYLISYDEDNFFKNIF